MKSKEKVLRYVVYMIPILHFIFGANFWLTHKITSMEGKTLPIYVRRIGSSSEMERSIFSCVVLAVSAGVIILMWRKLMQGWKKHRIQTIIIVVVSLGISMLIVPYNYGFEVDNLEIYTLMRRWIPEYWHGYYQSVIYGICNVVFPHPMTVTVIQIAVFLASLFYVQNRLRELKYGKLSWLIFGCLFFPNSIYILLNPYRNDMNAIMCMWTVGVLLMDALEGKTRNAKQILVMTAWLGWLVAYRRENIFLLIFAFALFVYNYHVSAKQMIAYGICLASVFGLLYIPQRVGMEQYYGKDYEIINHFDTLQFVLGQEDLNDSYSEFHCDIEAIEAIVPVDIVKENGLSGFRAYNLEENGVLNQTFASKEEQNAFLKAVRRIYLRNWKLFIQNRLITFLESNAYGQMNQMLGNAQVEALVSATIENYHNNFAEMMYYCSDISIWNNRLKNDIAYQTKQAIDRYLDVMVKWKIWFCARLLLYFVFLVVSICEILHNKEKKWVHITFLFSQINIIMVVAVAQPQGQRMDYFAPVVYMMYLYCFIMMTNKIMKHNMKYIDEK